MVCYMCGFVNEDGERFCGHCRTALSLQFESNADAVNPSWDLTYISSCNIFPENIINKRFKVIKVLGRGGMGEIYLAEDNKLQRKVAIKSISSDLLRDQDAKARFRREARAASRLDHPNICTIYEIAEENEREYIIMQYVDGVTLDQLQKMKILSLRKIIEIVLQITDAMIEAQAQNVMHLDIKPGNIMIDKNGKVKILDFGLAKIIPGKTSTCENSRPEPGLTEKGFVIGTLLYMSPEQTKGLELDGRSDIFSFGLVLYELLERKNPFVDLENSVTIYNILHKEIKLSPDIPGVLQKIVYKTLEKDRNRRYSNFREIKNDLIAVREPMLQNKTVLTKTDSIIIDFRPKISDAENLSELVQRLRQLKDTTKKILAFKSRKFWLKLAALTVLAILLALAL